MKTKFIFLTLTFLFFSVVLKAQYPNNKSGWINYFNERINTLDPIEGVWNECRGCGDAYSYDYSSGRKISTDPYTDIIAIYKEGNVYRTYLIKGTSVAEIYYEPTSTPGVYIMNTSYRFTSDTERETIKMTNSGLIKTKETTYLDNGYIVSTSEYTKLHPNKKGYSNSNNTSNENQSKLEIIWKDAVFQYKEGNYKESIDLLNVIAKQRPDFSSSYFYLTNCFLAIDDIINSKKNLAIYKSLEPTNILPVKLAVSIAFKEKNYIEVIKNLNKIIEEEPENHTAYLRRGIAKSELKDYFGSTKDYEKAIELKPDYSMAYNNIAWNNFLQGNFEKALEYANKAIKFNDINDTALDSRADIKFALKDYNGCIEDSKASLAINPKQSNPYFLLGRANYRLGNKKIACENWSKAGELGKIEAYEYISKYCQ